MKIYLNVACITKDGLLVVHCTDPLSPSTDLIIVPRSVLDGLITALHIKLDHPSKHQLNLVTKRHFYALDMLKMINRVSKTCHTCVSLCKLPEPLMQQNTEDPAKAVGISFAADVIKQCKQSILVLHETTSFTSASIIPNEESATLRDLASLCVALHPLDGPPAVIRVDSAPGFIALKHNNTLKQLGITLDIGRVKNVNKNPFAEKAIAEIEDELFCQVPNSGPVTNLSLSIAIARLNSRLCRHGISAHELWTQRNQFIHNQLQISDRNIIINQCKQHEKNHPYSERSKNWMRNAMNPPNINIGDLVYLHSDHKKTHTHSRYLVVSINSP